MPNECLVSLHAWSFIMLHIKLSLFKLARTVCVPYIIRVHPFHWTLMRNERNRRKRYIMERKKKAPNTNLWRTNNFYYNTVFSLFLPFGCIVHRAERNERNHGAKEFGAKPLLSIVGNALSIDKCWPSFYISAVGPSPSNATKPVTSGFDSTQPYSEWCNKFLSDQIN